MSSTTTNMSSSSSLEKLPLEIRHEIYRHLVGRHTRRDHDMKSKQYDRNRSVNFGPDHTNQFHDSILRVNRQVRKEALGIFQSETPLILLILPRQEGVSGQEMANEITDYGVALVGREDLECFNPPFAMSIDMVDGFDDDEGSMNFVFTADDLPAACVYIQRKIHESSDNSHRVYMYVETCPSVVEAARLLQDDASPRRGTKLSKCLEPLRQIRGASQVVIDGNTSRYTAALAATMTEQRHSPIETMDLVAAHFDRGDQYLLTGAPRRSITEYKAAFQAIQRGVFNGVESNEEVVGGRFNGLSAGWARDLADIQLHAKIASTYMQLGQLRMARIYVSRVCLPLSVKDDKGFLVKFFLNLPDDEDTRVFAELLFVAAQISIATGNDGNAWGELSEAHRHDPDRKDITTLLKQCETRMRDRKRRQENRRQKTRGEQARSYKRKYEVREVDIQVARNRIVKADGFFRVGDLLGAQEWYEAAYQKVQRYSYDAQADILIADALTRLTRVSMELRDDDAARHWIDSILALDHRCADICILTSRTDVYYADEACYLAYYSKGVMLQRQGKITGAILNFEAALRIDRGCHATYYQLENLRRQETDEDIKRYEDAEGDEWERMNRVTRYEAGPVEWPDL